MRELAHADKERTSILFSVAFGWAMFVFIEMGRRQRVREAEDDARRNYIDGKLSENDRQILEASARAAGAAEAAKAQRERTETRWTRGNMVWGGMAALLTLVVTVIAYKLIA
jgi:hypothetical protein